MKSDKRYAETMKNVDRTAFYDVADATALVKKNVSTKFNGAVRVHTRTGYDGRHADQQIRDAIVLPHGTGKTIRILVFAKGPKADRTQAADTGYVDAEELIPRIQNDGWLGLDVVVTAPNMMGIVGRLGHVLGPKGLMPNPEVGAATMDTTRAINDIKAGKIEYRLDETNIIHVPVGRAPFTKERLVGNFQTLIDVTAKVKPSTAKDTYLKSAALASTIGPGVKLNVAKLVNQSVVTIQMLPWI